MLLKVRVSKMCFFLFSARRHGDGGRGELQSGSEAAVLSGQGLREEEQHPHHG